MSKRVTISRDPFSRSEVVRETAGYSGKCSWCGNNRSSNGIRRELFRYGEESDSGRVSWDEREFCSIGCRRAYYS
jgi:hypothetical protein